MKDKKRNELLEKFNLGKASAHEIKELEQHADELIQQSQKVVFASDVEKFRIKKELKGRISLKQSTGFNWGRIAASIALLIGFSASFWFGKDIFLGPDQLIVETSYGERREVVLPDGSTVFLNAESKLAYPETFAENKREVLLTGEALFEVNKNPNKPFSVTSNTVKTTVLGTQFNVSAYPADSIVQVSLIEGSVQIDQQNNSVLLAPSEASFFDQRSGALTKSEFDPTTVLAWKEHKIVLSKTKFSTLKNIISREYGVEIRFSDSEIGEYTVSGTFDQPELKTLLATVCATKSLQYERLEDNAILLYRP